MTLKLSLYLVRQPFYQQWKEANEKVEVPERAQPFCKCRIILGE